MYKSFKSTLRILSLLVCAQSYTQEYKNYQTLDEHTIIWQKQNQDDREQEARNAIPMYIKDIDGEYYNKEGETFKRNANKSIGGFVSDFLYLFNPLISIASKEKVVLALYKGHKKSTQIMRDERIQSDDESNHNVNTEFTETHNSQILWIIKNHKPLNDGFEAINNHYNNLDIQNPHPRSFHDFLIQKYPQDISDDDKVSFPNMYGLIILDAQDIINDEIKKHVVPELQKYNPYAITNLNLNDLKNIDDFAPIKFFDTIKSRNNPIMKYAQKYKNGATNIAIKYAIREWIINTPDKQLDNQTLLFKSIMCGQHELTKNLLNNFSIDLTAKDINKETALFYAIDFKDYDAAKMLLEHGVNIHAINATTRTTVLHHAAMKNYINFVKLLLQHGANKDILDRDKKTPLHHAVERNYINIAQLLLQHGANKDILDNGNKKAQDYARTDEMRALFV